MFTLQRTKYVFFVLRFNKANYLVSLCRKKWNQLYGNAFLKLFSTQSATFLTNFGRCISDNILEKKYKSGSNYLDIITIVIITGACVNMKISVHKSKSL